MKFFKHLLGIKLFLIMITLSVHPKAWTMDEGERITVRFLKVSSSKKTVLINRGTEDGIAVSDHAKFFLTEGVVSRGVAEKVAPTRSIWSIYRLVDPNDIFEGKVVDIIKSDSAKITEDHTRSLKVEMTKSGVESLGIPVAEGGDDLPKDLNNSEASDLNSLEKGNVGNLPVASGKGYIANLDTLDSSRAQGRGMDELMGWEFTGLITWGSFSMSSETDVEGSESVESSQSDFSFSTSVERYFPRGGSFLRRLSLAGFYEYAGSTQTFTDSDQGLVTKQHKFGFGSHFHFQDPFAYDRLIFFASGKLGLINESSAVGDTTTSGSGLFGAIGAGIKFYTYSNFGVRLLLDYYFEQTKSENSITSVITTYGKSGPKLYIGLSYRF